MTYIYYNKEGIVKMRSEKKLKDCGNLIEEKVTFTKADKEKINKNYGMKFTDKVEFIKTPQVEAQEAQKAKNELIEKAKDGTATLQDTINFITQYI